MNSYHYGDNDDSTTDLYDEDFNVSDTEDWARDVISAPRVKPNGNPKKGMAGAPVIRPQSGKKYPVTVQSSSSSFSSTSSSTVKNGGTSGGQSSSIRSGGTSGGQSSSGVKVSTTTGGNKKR